MNINFKKLTDSAHKPAYGSMQAAGADLYASNPHDVVIAPHATEFISTGIAVEIPDGCVGLIFARSGIAMKRDLAPANKVGVIDSDYRGEIKVALHNHGESDQIVKAGERIAQLVIVPYVQCAYTCVDELTDTARGAGGFGSTGEK